MSYTPTTYRAFLWDGGPMMDLGTLGGHVSYACAINDLGYVTGWAQNMDEIYHAFLLIPEDTDGNGIPDLWYQDLDGDGANGLMLDLGTLGGVNSIAHDINSTGQVAGRADSLDGGVRAYFWENGEMTDLGTGPFEGFSVASGMNNFAQVVGWVGYTDTWDVHGFIWANNVMMDLGTLGRGNSSAINVNELGQVVGFSHHLETGERAYLLTPEDTDGDGVPDLWYRDENEDGANDLMLNLGTLGGRNSVAWDINNFSQIVGSSETSSEEGHAFLWKNGIMLDLHELIPSGSGLTIYYARRINEAGQILVSAGHDLLVRSHAGLLIPR